MFKENKRQAQSQNEPTSLLIYQGSSIAFERINGELMVNATQMARPFGKIPADWLKTQQAKDLLKAFSDMKNIGSADLQIVRKGGDPQKQGTWLREDVALCLAQWLSPEFYVLCNMKLKELLIKENTENSEVILGVYPIYYDGLVGYPRYEILKAAGYSPRSGMVQKLKQRYPEHHFMICRTACVSREFALLRAEQGKVRQLTFDFSNNKGGVLCQN